MVDKRNEKCKELLEMMLKKGCNGFGDTVNGYYIQVNIEKLKKKCPTCGKRL